METQEKEYSVFISYKSEDVEWAIWLQHELEHYHLPTTLNGFDDVQQNLKPVFRDIDELSAGNLPEQIGQALRNSKNLVVICSPLSAKSEWVNEEVKTFIALGRVDKIFPFIVDGESPTVFFPPALLDLPKNQERLGGDVNKNGKDAAFVKIVAGILDLKFDTLWNRYEREKAEEERKNREQRDNLLRIQSLFLAEKANNLIDNHEYDIANLLALEALPINMEEPNRPYVSEVECVLRKSSIYLTPIIRSVLNACIKTNGNIVIIEDYNLKLKVWNIHTGELIKIVNLRDALKEFKFLSRFGNLTKKWLKAITFSQNTDKNEIYFCAGNSLYAFDYYTGQIRLLRKINDNYYIENGDIIVSPDGHYYVWLVGASWAEEPRYDVYLCDSLSNEELLNYKYTADVSCSFSPNSNLIAFACHHDVHVIDINTKDCIAKYRFYDVILCMFVDDSNVLIVCSDKSVRLWNILSYDANIIHRSDVEIIDVLYMDNILVYVTISNKICVFDIQYELIIAQLEWSESIRLLSFSSNEKKVYFRDVNSFRVWDYNVRSDGSRILYYHHNTIHCTAYSKDNSCFVSVSDDGVKLWDVEKNTLIKSIALENEYFVDQMAVSMIYKKIFFISSGFYCMDIDSGNIKLISELDASEINFSCDEKYISISVKNTITIFETESLDIYRDIILPQEQELLWGGKALAFHPTEKLLVTASDKNPFDLILDVWDYQIGILIVSIEVEANCGNENFISFSECGDYVIYKSAWAGEYRWDFRNNVLEKNSQEISFSLQFSNRIIVEDGCYVIEKENLSIQQLMNKVRKSLNGRQLTMEERKKYYLD